LLAFLIFFSEKSAEKEHEEESKEENKEEETEDIFTFDETQTADVEIKHFIHPTIEIMEHLQHLTNKMMIKLKNLAEKINLVLANIDPGKKEYSNYQRQIVNKDFNEETKLLSEFEKNLLLCLNEEFGLIKQVESSKDIAKMQKELTWIRLNFPAYMTK